MQILLILTGLLLLIIALVRLVFDGMIIYESAIISFETLNQSWQEYFPVSLEFIEKYIPETVWDPYIFWVLQQYSFVVFGISGLAFILLSFMFRQRNKRKLADEFI